MSLIFALFSKYFPINKAKYQTLKSLTELKKEFRTFDILILLLFFVSTPFLVYASYKIFGAISDFRFSKFANDGYLFLPDRMMWFGPAIFSGLGLSAFIFTAIQKPILKEKYNDYIAYSNLKYGYDSDKVIKILIKFLIVIVTGFFIFAINNFASFGTEKIVISNFFQLTESKYNYKDVARIKSVDKLIAPNGNIVSDKHYIIDFSDSNKWSSRQGGDSDYDKDTDMIKFISAKTGLKLEYLEFDK
jgi:hypothetical protein